MSKNPEDYYMQGHFIKNRVGEDVAFLDLVEMRWDKKYYLMKDSSDVAPVFQGQMMESLRKDEVGNIMLHGFIIPKGTEDEYIMNIKRGAMLEIFGAIGEAFGFEVRPLGETTNDKNQN